MMTEDAKLVEMLTRECSDLMKELIDLKAANVVYETGVKGLNTEIKHLNHIIGRKKTIIFVGAVALGYCGYELHKAKKELKKLKNDICIKPAEEVFEDDDFLS